MRQAVTKQKRLRRQNRKRRMLGREDHHSGEFNTEGLREHSEEKERRPEKLDDFEVALELAEE